VHPRISSKDDFKRYVEADRRNEEGGLRYALFNGIRRFKRLLRKAEYYTNCRRDPFGRLVGLYLRYRLSRLGRQLGFSIPVNAFGPGLCIPHWGTIVVNSNARIGANCKIHVCVVIGASGGQDAAPRIGDNVYIGPGAKIFGNISIADDIAIAANSVVSTSFTKPAITIAGVPARKILGRGSYDAGWRPQNGNAGAAASTAEVGSS